MAGRHAHLRGLATAIHEIFGLERKLTKSQTWVKLVKSALNLV